MCLLCCAAVLACCGGAHAAAPAWPPAATVVRLPQTEEPWQDLERRLAAAEAELAALRAATAAPAADEGDWSLLSEEEVQPAEAESSPPQYPNVALHGAFQADSGWFRQDETSLASYGPLRDGGDFRRARLSANGELAENVRYFFQMDFGFFGRPTFTDVWVEGGELPLLGTVRLGQWKHPFSLEVASSYRYTTFMERSVLFTAFTPFRHVGGGFYNHSADERMTWAWSAFHQGQDQFGGSLADNGGYGECGRITWLPYYDESCQGRRYLHLGGAQYYAEPANDTHRYRTIPELFIGETAPGPIGTSGIAAPGAPNGTPNFVDTGPLGVQRFLTWGGELLWVEGPFSLQSEGMVSLVDQTAGPTVGLAGGYLQAGWFLTGEHRPYNRRLGAIERVEPLAPCVFLPGVGPWAAGCGAWELAGRLSYIDLNAANVRGGRLLDTTLGVNWHVNAYWKLAFNYVHAAADHPLYGASSTHLFGIRAQADF